MAQKTITRGFVSQGLDQSAVEVGGGDGDHNQQQVVDGEEKDRATEENPRATVLSGAVGSSVEPTGPDAVAKDTPMGGGSSGGVGGTGAVDDDPGLNGTPPRDSARGKGAVIAEKEERTEVPVEYREQDIAFRLAASAATSSSHVSITKYDIAEHLPDNRLARLLEENPEIGEIVLKEKEEHARAIAALEAAERAERERKDGDPLREMEAEERAAEEAQGPRVTAMAEAANVRRPDYAAETYTPHTQHLFVSSGFSAYTPQRSEYDDEVMLRDSQTHIANTWSEVTIEEEAEQMARAYLLYLFGATLYPNRRSRVHLSDLPAVRDLRTASRFDWGGAALGTAYAFLVHSSRTGKSTVGYWRVWELWAYEVLRMYPPQCKHPDLSTLPRALIWNKKNMGPKEGRGDLNAFRLYLDELRASQVYHKTLIIKRHIFYNCSNAIANPLYFHCLLTCVQINWNPWSGAGAEPNYVARSRAITASRVLLESAFGWQRYLEDRVSRQSLGYRAFQVPGPLPPRASHTSTYTRAELERFTRLDTLPGPRDGLCCLPEGPLGGATWHTGFQRCAELGSWSL
ncbi:hypothetical protein RHMOL_Rhmol13G0187100 [Rhododendron molle]|uniref:Uncharacterized protein n=1 Tax=Rhododendron molle TaxID=49168 RepID=A0ACC0L880_RHOML|nr:hypothetical protein RHMOL_Rhmol13G0187100 [Rhododendron molle]